jgi:hypothetical protein
MDSPNPYPDKIHGAILSHVNEQGLNGLGFNLNGLGFNVYDPMSE